MNSSTLSTKKRKILIGIVLARCPESSSGHVCATLNWVFAFLQTGCEVFLVEAISSSELTYKSKGFEGQSDQEHMWHETLKAFDLAENACLLIDGKSPDRERMEAFAEKADLFLNYSGQFALQKELPTGLCKAYLDVDPAFTQIWAAQYGCPMNFEGHDVHLTIGLQLDKRSARVPRTGYNWRPILPPLPAAYFRALAESQPRHSSAPGAWTTVGHWYGYNMVEWGGLIYHGKRESFLAMKELPRLLPGKQFAIATDLQPEWNDFDGFVKAGWTIVKAAEVCSDVPAYLAFLKQSKGEIGIAKGGYIVSRCGWISDRSLIYLALGRPVLLQDTGWPEAIPTKGVGLLPFATPMDCARKILEIEADYEVHCAAAKELADTLFAPEKTVTALLAACGI